MFTSSKIIDSPRINSNTIHSGMSETANGIPRSFIQPKITSTPLMRRESIFATPPKPRILGPRRYSLSDIATPPRTSKRDPTKIHTAGPLLASTRYNVNVSTYEDTRSPGLAGRIVQYNDEAERERERQRPPTHQAKYGSPGLFPVVHLFKKKLPTLDQKPRRVTIRIASPEYSRQHSQEYNRKLLEGIVKPGSPTSTRRLFTLPTGAGNSSTRSVLDALKEISRKRIHANEEYEQNEDSGKRLRTEQFNGVDSTKRVRDGSPLLDTSSSPTKPVPKRVCMYDEYAASCSSMDFSFKKADQSGPKRKSISISTLTDNPKDSKQVKLINAETQTVTSENKKSTQSKEYIAEENVQNKIQTDADDDEKAESPPKVFDDAPLERIRKNRLAALMGSLTGKDAFIAPKPDFSTSLDSSSDTSKIPEITISEVYKAPDKPLISILSTPKKASPNKSNKHVHFSIPESTSQTNITSTPITSFSVTQSSTSIVTPISSVSESKITFGSSKSEERLETPAPPSSPVSLTPSSTSVTTAVPVIMFGTGSNSSSLTSVVSKESSSLAIESSKSDMAVPNFQFKNTASSTGPVGTTSSITFSSGPASITTFGSSVAKPSSSTASPPKLGGFKFDLNKSASTTNTTATSNVPTFSFGNTSQTEINKSKSILGSPINNSDPKSSQPNLALTPVNFSFGPKGTSAVSSASNSNTSITSSSTGAAFGTNTTASSAGTQVTTVVPSFKFGSNNVNSNSGALGGFGVATTNSPFGTPSTTSSTPSFGTNTSTPAFGRPNTSAPTFGPNISTPTFGANPSTAPSTTSASPFGTSKPPAYPFGSSNAPSSFGVPTTTSASITFGAPSTTTALAPAGFAVSTTSPSSGFGSTSTSVPSIGFGSTTTPSSLGGFGAPSTSANTGFGTSTVPMFGANKAASPFGATTSATPAFGTPPVSNASPFGKSSASPFGQNTTQSGFGTTTTTESFGTAGTFIGTTTTASSVFGGSSTATPSFGVKTGGFGATSTNTNIFGAAPNTQVSGFGATTSPFGNPNPAATTAAPSFGNNASTFSFGAKTTASSSFGSGNAFGTTTTTSSTGFGTSATPAFNASNSFGSTSSFGSGNAFGSSGTPAFGGATTTTQSGGFGTTNTSTFGATNAGFNAPNKSAGFGNSAAPAFGATAAPSFGATAPATGFGSSNMSGFGANAAASAFSKPQTAQNAFGSTSNAFGTSNNFAAAQPQSSGFGATNAPTTQSGVFSFGSGAPQKPASIFSFGAASSSSEAPKPSFNFTGGNTAAPAFGGAGTSSFGANAPPLQFNAPQPAAPGMFSIGSGSSSVKSRTHLKAKRRT